MKLAIFDMDGTLIDSQVMIVAAMNLAFESAGLTPPSKAETLSIVGLSLHEAIATLAPYLSHDDVADLVPKYSEAFVKLRAETGGEAASPLYPGARDALEALDADGWLMGVATGKAKRGLDHALDKHDLRRLFVTAQCADFHPSKPHPAMVLAAVTEAGVDIQRAVMIGDTTFDMDMGRSAGVKTLGVSWGYHDVATLNADATIDRFEDMPALLNRMIP